MLGLLRAGDPRQEVWFAWNAKEVVRQIYDHTDPELADAWVAEIGRDFADTAMPVEVRRLGRTITRWADQICAWHSHVTNGPTEAVTNWPSASSEESRSGLVKLPTSPSPLPALRRQARREPATRPPTLKRK